MEVTPFAPTCAQNEPAVTAFGALVVGGVVAGGVVAREVVAVGPFAVGVATRDVVAAAVVAGAAADVVTCVAAVDVDAPGLLTSLLGVEPEAEQAIPPTLIANTAARVRTIFAHRPGRSRAESRELLRDGG